MLFVNCGFALDQPAHAAAQAAKPRTGLTAKANATAAATPSSRQMLLQFISNISGTQTMAGQHNRESQQGNFIQIMDNVTGDYPALWGGDFLYESDQIANRPNMIAYEIQGGQQGAVISLMYHACPPTQSESCNWQGGVLSSLTNAQWSDLVTNGGTLNHVWKSRLDNIAPYLLQIQNAGLPMLFRPQHEMNQGAFWWGGRPGPNGTVKLFQITHDYLVNNLGLTGIVWVWSMQDIWDSSTNSYDFSEYDPGSSYWDVMALDFYDGAGYTTAKYNDMTSYAGSKPIAIGECEVLPTPAILAAQPRWIYFMGWAELIQEDESNQAIQATYGGPSVLTINGNNKMPGWAEFALTLTPPLSAQAASLAAEAGGGSLQVNVPAGVSWTASSNDSWIAITAGASGTGSGSVSFSLDANTGAARTGTITIDGLTFIIEQESGSAMGLGLAGSMPQIASAGGWDTSLTLVNLGTSAADARLNFYANDGSTPWFPFTFPQQPAQGTMLGSTFDQNINANATLVLDTTGLSQASAVGSSQLLTSGDIGAFAVFTYTPSGQAAVVPLETRNASSYLLAFDNTGAVSTGLAIANVAASAAAVNVVIRDDTGAQIGTGTISLLANGHTSFTLADTSSGGWSVTAGKRGTVEFDTPSGGQISVLGLRANAIPNSANFAVTTIPTLANVATGGGTMAHIASGGGWQTTLTLVNTGASEATVNLNFYGDNGAAVSLPLSFPQGNSTATSSSASQSIAAGASLIVVLQDGAASPTTGSAVLTTTGNVGGFAVFRYNPSGQEAVVPLETVNAPSYVLAFDNTGTLATGLAIANVAAQTADVNVVIRDDTGAQIGTGSISLAAQGHTSFMLTDTQGFPITAGKRGTITFETPQGGQIAPLGLRAASISGGFTITTIPVMTQ
jgi:hypothetical protein